MRITKFGWIGISLFAAAIALPLGAKAYRRSQEDAEFDRQLRLARAEGIPTTAREYQALIRPANPAENAALLYRRLERLSRPEDLTNLKVRQVAFTTDPAVIASARRALAEGQARVDIADQAVALPRCWFDRDWRNGVAVMFPENRDIRFASQLFAIRGSLAAIAGKPQAAIADAKRIQVLAKHVDEEPHMLAQLARSSLHKTGIQSLADWSFRYPDRPEYLAALRQAVAELPKRDLQRESLGELYGIFSLIELCQTPEGRRSLGLREEDIGVAVDIFPLIFSQSKARAEIVKAVRKLHAALAEPPNQAKYDRAHQELLMAMLAYPIAADIYEKLSFGPILDTYKDSESTRLQYLALVRAIENRPIPKSIRTDDLRSPYDGKPLIYRSDGSSLSIQVSGHRNEKGPIILRFPPKLP